jgi:hypothetical protein
VGVERPEGIKESEGAAESEKVTAELMICMDLIEESKQV